MKTIRELLQDADPIRHERMCSPDQRDAQRQMVLAATSGDHVPGGSASRSRWVVVMIATLTLVASLLGFRVWSPLVSDLQAAVRFEIRLAEDKPAPGLRETKVSDSGRSIYLHVDPIVTNSEIAEARVVQGESPAEYGVRVEFNGSGAEKMGTATGDHIGRPLAILIDGQVVMAPVLRSPIRSSAVVSGHFTRAQAERIAQGIAIR